MSITFPGVTMQQWEIFLSTAKNENFTLAASELNLSVSAVSRSIASLEEQLGIVLFVRHKRRVRLTPTGRFLLEEIEPMSTQLMTVIDRAMELQGCQYNTLHLADFRVTDPSYYLLPVLDKLEEKHPEISIEVEAETLPVIVQGLLTGRFDAAFMIDSRVLLEDTKLVFQQILPAEGCLVISNRHPLFNKPDLSWEDLRNDPIVSSRGGLYDSYRKLAESFFRKYGFSMNDIRYVNNAETMDTELHRGRCVALLSTAYANEQRMDLRAIRLPEKVDGFNVGIVHNPENINPNVNKLLICAKKAFADRKVVAQSATTCDYRK